MGAILAALQESGLVSRSGDPSDGRRVLMSITAAGPGRLTGRATRESPAVGPGHGRGLHADRAAPTDRGHPPAAAAGPACLRPPSGPIGRASGLDRARDRYKWIALTNTSLGSFMAILDSSIVIIAMPAIFRGIGLNPLAPGNIGYLLWMIMGYVLVTAVLVVSLGRLGRHGGPGADLQPRLRRLYGGVDRPVSWTRPKAPPAPYG